MTQHIMQLGADLDELRNETVDGGAAGPQARLQIVVHSLDGLEEVTVTVDKVVVVDFQIIELHIETPI